MISLTGQSVSLLETSEMKFFSFFENLSDKIPNFTVLESKEQNLGGYHEEIVYHTMHHSVRHDSSD